MSKIILGKRQAYKVLILFLHDIEMEIFQNTAHAYPSITFDSNFYLFRSKL
jgi:hypothetical protein